MSVLSVFVTFCNSPIALERDLLIVREGRHHKGSHNTQHHQSKQDGLHEVQVTIIRSFINLINRILLHYIQLGRHNKSIQGSRANGSHSIHHHKAIHYTGVIIVSNNLNRVVIIQLLIVFSIDLHKIVFEINLM